jgi:two-component system response regulator YesN
MRRKFSEFPDLKPSIGVSELHDDLSEIPTAYEEAKYALNYRLLYDRGNVFLYNQVIKYSKYNTKTVDEIGSSLYHRLVIGKAKEAKEMISHIFYHLQRGKQSTISSVFDTCSKIIAVMNSSIHSIYIQKNDQACPYIHQLKMGDWKNIEEMREQFNAYIDAICNLSADRKDNHFLVNHMMEYISNHYYSDISLDELAKNHYFLDPSHLSRLFKKVTHKNFSEFLLEVRMEKAKDLLEHRDLSITEIAGSVGYNDASYFAQLFKKFFGYTPGQYRKSPDLMRHEDN